MSQALSNKTIEEILDPTPVQQSSPKILSREVFKKEAKGSTAVRKIVTVERIQEGFHRYTTHYTDYSEGRAEPLKTQTYVAETKTRLEEILTQLKKETSKKGWTKL
jgi:hypothetical protein